MTEQQWLIRKRRGGLESSIKVLGPFWSGQVRDMVLNGSLELEDEVCVENGYWIGLHERDEIKNALGVDPVARTPKTNDLENTQPDIEQTDEITLGQTIQAKDVQVREQFQRLSASVIPRVATPNPKFLGVEKSRYWGILLVVITIAAIAGVLWLIRVLDI